MNKSEIENYLNQDNHALDESILNEINAQRIKAIERENENEANDFWCLKQIFVIQRDYLEIYFKLNSGNYEEAWRLLESVDIALSFLESNFTIPTSCNDLYHLKFIKKAIPQYQKLFPYQYFFSRGAIIKKEICTICGQTIRIRNSCKHRVGKLYMGELCCRKVVNYELLEISIVKDPFDKYTVLHLEGKEYNYSMLEKLMHNLSSPYDAWSIDELPVIRPDYMNIGRNSPCPCGSGRKFKNCCLGTDKIYTTHYKIKLIHPPTQDMQKPFFTSTWK